MREIKFRAWDEAGKFMDHFDVFSMLDCHRGWCWIEKDKVSIDIKDGRPIMQYTGLKDKNCKDIYEGDIVKKIQQECRGGKVVSEEELIGPVIFSKGFFVIDKEVFEGNQWSGGLIKPLLSNWIKDFEPENYSCEVIGNIHETPELL